MVFLVLVIVRAEFGEHLAEHALISRIFCRHEALDQLEHAVANLIAVGVDGERGPSMLLAYVIACAGEVFDGVEDRSV